jgi:hypothetical protein
MAWVLKTTSKYRVIHKSLRDFRPLRYSSRDDHAEGEHVNRGRDTPIFLCTGQFWQIPIHNAFLFPVHAMFRHNCHLAVKPASTPRRLGHKKTWRDSLPVDMLPFGVTIPATVPQRSKIPEGLMNYPVYVCVTAYLILDFL